MNATRAQCRLLLAVQDSTVRRHVSGATSGMDFLATGSGYQVVTEECREAQAAGWIELVPGDSWWRLTGPGRAVLAVLSGPQPQVRQLTAEEAQLLLQALVAVWRRVIETLRPVITKTIEDFRALAAYLAAHPEIFEPPPTSPPDGPHD